MCTLFFMFISLQLTVMLPLSLSKVYITPKGSYLAVNLDFFFYISPP